MYRKFYGLDKKPFELAPLGGLVYLSEAHKEGLAILRYGVIADKGFLLLTGGVGAGKTTVLNTMLDMLPAEIDVCLLNNPKMDRFQFFYFLGAKLGIKCNGNKSLFILKFYELLEKYGKEGRKLLLIIDEAQAFSIDLLEEIRLLSNHAEGRNVFSIFLIGQPELQEKLASPQLLPLRQRIGVKYHLTYLTREETSQYIVYRLQMAGAVKTSIFDKKAVDCIYAATRGTPRLINILCDHALIFGFTREMHQINKDIIKKSIQAISLQGEESAPISPVQASSKAVPRRNYAMAALLLTLLLAGAVGFFYFNSL
jgi:general secretion pathway protein A